MVFILASTDHNSEGRLLKKFPNAKVIRTPRAREVGQSWSSTVRTTFIALLYAVWTVFRESPDSLLCNGPGTCVPVAYAAFLMRMVSCLSLCACVCLCLCSSVFLYLCIAVSLCLLTSVSLYLCFWVSLSVSPCPSLSGKPLYPQLSVCNILIEQQNLTDISCKLQVYCKSCKIAFIESIARVHSLSLSGKLLYPIADRFLVQWEELERKYKRAKYVGFVIWRLCCLCQSGKLRSSWAKTKFSQSGRCWRQRMLTVKLVKYVRVVTSGVRSSMLLLLKKSLEPNQKLHTNSELKIEGWSALVWNLMLLSLFSSFGRVGDVMMESPNVRRFNWKWVGKSRHRTTTVSSDHAQQ